MGQQQEKDPMGRALASTVSGLHKGATGQSKENNGTEDRVDPVIVTAVINEWPTVPRKAVEDIVAKYGQPNEATPSRLIWFGNGVWKRTIVYRDEVPHSFPKPHVDVLEQFIDYQVPVEKCDELVAFDGSLIIERTKGELSVRCDMESMNFLALNLAHDIVAGKRTVEEARQYYAETAAAFMMKRSTPYTERLLFEVPVGGTADADQAMIGEAMLHQMVEKTKEVFTGERKPAP